MTRQAVLLIHGMGEQIPMGTLNGFVDAVWTTDDAQLNRQKPDPTTGENRESGSFDNAAWYKPDDLSESFELRRITTETSANGNRTDFFEFYWAHQISGMTIKDVLSWIKYLLFRNPFKSVPKDVLFSWCLLWTITLLILAGTVFKALPEIHKTSVQFTNNSLQAGLGTAIFGVIASLTATAVGGLIIQKLVSHFGDVIRYVRPHPPNVSTRQRIREDGVQLLEKILELKDKNNNLKFERVVVVAHSLGTIVGYDILTHAFSRMHKKFSGTPSLEPERNKLESLIRESEYSTEEYQGQQNKAIKELVSQGHPWRVTDFITLGSPLTHSEFLIENDIDALRLAQIKRVYPTCPPTMEYDMRTQEKHFTYGQRSSSLKGNLTSPRFPNHAAVFAFTRWSNIFSPSRFTLWGDQVSGPLEKNFGDGIRDIQVMPGLDENGIRLKSEKIPFLAHVKYWSFGKNPKNDPPYHIKALRKVLQL